MARSWKDVKADQIGRDAARGRDRGTARTGTRTRTQAYLLGFRLAQLRDEIGMSQVQLAAVPNIFVTHRGVILRRSPSSRNRHTVIYPTRTKRPQRRRPDHTLPTPGQETAAVRATG
jgi:hypothetical protein